MSEGRKVRPEGEHRLRQPSLGMAILGQVFSGLMWGWLLLFLILCVAGYDKGYPYAFTKGSQDLSKMSALIEESLSHEVGFWGEGDRANLFQTFLPRSYPALPQWFRVETDKGQRVGEDLLYSWGPKEKRADVMGFWSRLSEVENGLRVAVVLFCLSGAILLLKALFLGLALPLFVLAIGVGVSDGLMLRTIRRENLGRESAYVFHTLLTLFPRVLGLVLIGYGVLPFSESLPYVILVMALGVGLWSAEITSRFKKYL